MDYELAKRLKDAGFPQNFRNGDWYFSGEDGEEMGFFCSTDGVVLEGERNYVKIPTLSELIEECGDGFNQLTHDRNRNTNSEWVASREVFYDDAGYRDIIGGGSTPEEAVANLWLKLRE